MGFFLEFPPERGRTRKIVSREAKPRRKGGGRGEWVQPESSFPGGRGPGAGEFFLKGTDSAPPGPKNPPYHPSRILIRSVLI